MSHLPNPGAASTLHKLIARSLRSDITILAAANVGSSALTFVALFALGLSLRSAEFLQITVAWSTAALVTNVCDVPITFHRAMGFEETQTRKLGIRAWRYGCGLTTSLIASQLHSYIRLSLGEACVIGVIAVSTSEFNAQLALLQARKRFRRWSVAYLITNLLRAFTLYVLAHVGIALSLAVQCLPLLVGAAFLSLTDDHSPPSSSMRQPSPVKFLQLSALLNALTARIDVVVAAIALPTLLAAEYGRYNLLLNAILLLVGSVTSVLLPSVRDHGPMATYLPQALRVAAVVGVAGLAMLVLSGTSHTYRLAGLLIMITLPSLALASGTVVLSLALYLRRQGLDLFLVNLAELAIFLIVSLAFASAIGIYALVLGRISAMAMGSAYVLAQYHSEA